MQLIGPPIAVRAQALRDGVLVAGTNLTRGVGRLTLAPLGPGDAVTVRMFDNGGKVLAERPFAEFEANVGIVFEREFRDW